jgi:hypothetical protein
VAILTITEAAKLFGKSRTTLYKYNKSGELSFVSGSDGKPAVDMAEMLRVFGSVHNTSVLISVIRLPSVSIRYLPPHIAEYESLVR